VWYHLTKSPQKEEERMPDRTTIAIAQVDMLFSRNPFHQSLARIGIVVPSGGTLVSPDPNNPGMNLWLMDKDSLGWRLFSEYNPPNISPPVWGAINEEGGRVYYFWEVQNADENLRRSLKATFVWRGAGPHVVEGVVTNRHITPPPHMNSPWFEIGLELPQAEPVTGHHFYSCEGDGQYGYVEGNLPYFYSGWSCEGTPGWPGTPNHNYWGVTGYNEHSVAARGFRVEVTVP
jgi:hypothetical protein